MKRLSFLLLFSVIALNGHSYHLERLSNQQCSSDVLSDRLTALHKQHGDHLTWEQVNTLLSETTGLYTAVQLKPEEDAELQTAFQNMMRQQASVKTLYKDINALAAKALAAAQPQGRIGMDHARPHSCCGTYLCYWRRSRAFHRLA